MNYNDRNKVVNYFAYGSNMNPERMKERGVIFYSRERFLLRGYSLKFHKIARSAPNTGAANIVEDGQGEVEGALYRITWNGIRNLDKFEGYPAEYDRVTLKVQYSKEVEKEVLTYIAHPHKTQDGLKPTSLYLEHLLAARDILSRAYYNQLREWPTSD